MEARLAQLSFMDVPEASHIRQVRHSPFLFGDVRIRSFDILLETRAHPSPVNPNCQISRKEGALAFEMMAHQFLLSLLNFRQRSRAL